MLGLCAYRLMLSTNGQNDAFFVVLLHVLVDQHFAYGHVGVIHAGIRHTQVARAARLALLQQDILYSWTSTLLAVEFSSVRAGRSNKL